MSIAEELLKATNIAKYPTVEQRFEKMIKNAFVEAERGTTFLETDFYDEKIANEIVELCKQNGLKVKKKEDEGVFRDGGSRWVVKISW